MNRNSVLARARTALRFMSSKSQAVMGVASVLVQLRKGGVTPLGVVGAVAAVASLAGSLVSSTGVGQFLERCVELNLPGVDLSTLLCASRVPLPAGYGWDADWYAAECGGVRVVAHRHAKSIAYVDGAVEPVLAAARELLWRRGALRLAAADKSWCSPLVAVPSDEEPAIESSRARELWARRVEPWVRAGRPRSVLVDGRPGTGKSTAVRWVAAQAGRRLLRVPASELAYMQPEAVSALVGLLRPDVVVIDDVDRAGGHDSMLDMICKVRASCRLLIATTNDVSKITEAAVRPRRFDVHFTIDSLGDDFVRGFLGDAWAALDPEDRARVLLWPMAYLDYLREEHELVTDVDLSAEVAALELRLTKRAAAKWEQPTDPKPEGTAKSAAAADGTPAAG